MPDTVFLPDRIEVTRPIPASPSAIFDIAAQPGRSRRHRRLGDVAGLHRRAGGEGWRHVRDPHGPRVAERLPLGQYDVTVHIITFDRDKEIAWNLGPDIPVPHFYGYA